MADWLLALIGFGWAAYIGSALGRRDAERRATRDAIDTVIAESDAYRAEARRRVWAA